MHACKHMHANAPHLRPYSLRAWLVYGRFSDSNFFLFLELFLLFSEKKEFRHFFETNNFSSENLVGRKNFKKQISEIKKITREIYQMEETKNVHPNKKTRLIFF